MLKAKQVSIPATPAMEARSLLREKTGMEDVYIATDDSSLNLSDAMGEHSKIRSPYEKVFHF